MLKMKRTSKENPPANNKRLKVMIVTDGARGFFARGREIAKLADTGKPIPSRRIINFDSPEEMLAILTKGRLNAASIPYRIAT